MSAKRSLMRDGVPVGDEQEAKPASVADVLRHVGLNVIELGSDGGPFGTGPLPQTEEAVKARLEYLREEIKAERISTGEIMELQSLAEYIEPDDVLLLEWAGVPEHAPEIQATVKVHLSRINGRWTVAQIGGPTDEPELLYDENDEPVDDPDGKLAQSAEDYVNGRIYNLVDGNSALLKAAKAVLDNWEHGDLAGAVRDLAEALGEGC